VGNATVSSQTFSQSNSATAPAPGRIDGYNLIEIIAHGSSGDIWRATDAHGTPVAIKVFKKELVADSENLKRFHQEAKNLRRINNPNVVSVIESGETADHAPYIAMELLTGKTLKSKLEDEGVFEPRTAVTIARELCRALLAAHEQTIIHRDLKPSNIIVTDFNMTKLIDFGVAKATGYSGETITQVGEVVGTPAYMSPEQCLGGLVDERSDIYSLGCTLFEMLTGCKAFPSNSTVEAIAKQVSSDRAELQANIKATGIPLPLQQIVLKCLERDPAKRFQNVSQLENDLGAFLLGAPLRFTKSTPLPMVQSTSSKRRLLLAAAVVVSSALAFFSIAWFQAAHFPSTNPPLVTSLPPEALPSVSLPDFKEWVDKEAASQDADQDSRTAAMKRAFEAELKREPIGRNPDGEGVIYFTLNTNGTVGPMTAVAWRNKHGVVAARGQNISLVEFSLRSARFPASAEEIQMALVYTGSSYVFKNQNDMPKEMRLAGDTQ
jgi:serine/threonine protein kinase